jgi:hypothetical protein
MASVEFARMKMPNRAAKALAEAVEQDDLDEALDFLDQQQQQAAQQDQDEQDDDTAEQQNQQQQTAKALTKLITASRGKTTASEQQEDLEDISFEDLDEEDASQDEGDLDLSMDDEDMSQDDQDQQGQQQQGQQAAVKSSVSERLARAARNQSRRA